MYRHKKHFNRQGIAAPGVHTRLVPANILRVLSVSVYRRPEVFTLFEIVSMKLDLFFSSVDLILEISLHIVGLEGGKPEVSSVRSHYFLFLFFGYLQRFCD